MKKAKIITLIAIVAVLVTVLACCGKSQSLNLSPEAAAAYLSVFDSNKITNEDEAYAAFVDINDDGEEEMLLEVYGRFVAVFGYDYAEKKVVELHRKNLGKGYNMQGYYNIENNQVIFPSRSTGGITYDVVEFSVDEPEVVKALRYTNTKHSKSGEEEFLIDGQAVSSEEFDAAEKSLAEGFTGIDTPVAELIEVLSSLIPGENAA